MAAHRYWRATALEAYGAADLELSAFHLLAAGTLVDAPATLTASTAPDVSGTLANLQDADLSTAARWSGEAVKTLALTWDFDASPADVDGIQLAGDSESRFALIVGLQWSDDGVAWSEGLKWSGIQWPGMATAAAPRAYGSEAIWSASDKSSLLTIDPSGKIASLSSGAPSYASVRLGQPITQKTYWETVILTNGGIDSNYFIQGIMRASANVNGFPGSDANGYGYASAEGAVYHNLLRTPWGPGSLPTTGPGDVVGFAFDPYSLKFWVSKNGVWLNSGSPATGTGHLFEVNSGTYFPAIGLYQSGSAQRGAFEFLDLVFPPPGGFQVFDYQATAPTNRIKGRAAPASPLILGTGPAIEYGVVRLPPPAHQRVVDGFPDLITGVLGKGIGRVHGTVKNNGTPAPTPVARRVRLVRQIDGLQVREVWSDPLTGAYEFRFVDELQRYTVIANDHTDEYNDVIASDMVPDLMAAP